MIRTSPLAVWLLLVVLPEVAIAQDAMSLLAFCTGARPASGAVADFYDKECPSVLAAALSSGQQSLASASEKADADAESAKANLQKQQIENLKALLPDGASVPAPPTGVSLDPFAHLAQLRQIELFHDIGSSLVNDGALATVDATNTVFLVQEGDLQQLLRSTLPPEALMKELERTRDLLDATTCKPVPVNKVVGMRALPALGGALVVADSLFGLALKVSQAFQTNLMAASAAGLSSGGGEVVVVTLASKLKGKGATVVVGFPVIRSTNPILARLDDLQASSQKLVQAMSKAGEKDPCLTTGKALLDAMSSRLSALNSAPDATTPSPMLSSMRLAELRCPTATDSATCKNAKSTAVLVVSIDAILSGGSIAATKSAFTSQRYTRLSTAAVAYRVQDVDGHIRSAGIAMRPADTTTAAADTARLDKNLSIEKK